MNRALFITFGIVIIIVVFLVWLFLFFNGAPADTREVFSDLGIVAPIERPEVPIDNTDDDRVVLDLTDGELQQITTNPVAGFGVASSSGGTQLLRLVERGTGYIFEVNLESGLKTQATPSSFPNTTKAAFSPNLSMVVLISDTVERSVTLVTLPENREAEITRTNLAADIENIHFIDNATLTYTRNTYTDTTWYEYDLNSNTVTNQTTLPIPDARTIITRNNERFIYPKPTSVLPGAVYAVTGETLSPVTAMQQGTLPFITAGTQVVNYITDDSWQTETIETQNSQLISMLPEKCVGGVTPGQVWCGAPDTIPTTNYVEGWYKGTIASNDYLWEVDTLSNSVTLLTIPQDQSGRQLDVTNMQVGPQEENLFFINKIDAALWLFTL